MRGGGINRSKKKEVTEEKSKEAAGERVEKE